jgi:hypothetical protein
MRAILIVVAGAALIGAALWISGPSIVCGPGSPPGPTISGLFKIKGC